MKKWVEKTSRVWKKVPSGGGAAANQRGTALFIAVMMLSLVTGIGILAFNVSSTEFLISNYVEHELASTYLTESGVDLVLGWSAYPERSPDPDFFQQLPTRACTVTNSENTPYDYRVPPSYFDDPPPSIPFSEIVDMGKIVDIRFYRSERPDSLCTIEVKSVSTKGSVKRVRVDITRSAMRPITAGVQGLGYPNVSSPVWVHWGEIRYTGQARLGTGDPGLTRIPDEIVNPLSNPPNQMPYVEGPGNEDHWLEIHVKDQIFESSYPDDQMNLHEDNPVSLDSFDLNDLKKMIMQYGDYYIVSPSGTLVQNGVDKGTFDNVFHPASSEYRLAWIDVDAESSAAPIIMGEGTYKGYFYFSGDITIQGGQPGKSIAVASPPWPDPDSPRQAVTLSNVNMDGLLYVKGKINLEGSFSVYGAVFSELGFTGAGATRLEVWYNHSFNSAIYHGLPPIVLLKGTWKALPNLDV
ncbi:MAG: hypothetical protein ABGX83_10935 [Nitrospira sp.]|nr:hypothetical protein [Candidatus Manganitrophaceae bacterium]HIL34580.1 hypothetical protein [Candidatus Manganitrophaceae bacterium]